MKKNKILFLLFSIILIFSILGISASQSWVAVKPSYDSFVNGEKVNGNEVMNIDGSTYLKARYITEAMGGTTNFTDNKAYFDKGTQGSTETSNLMDWENIVKANVTLFKNNNKIGNGVFINAGNYNDGSYILVSKNAWKLRSIIIKDYKGDNVTIKAMPIINGERLVLLQTEGYKSNHVSELAEFKAESGKNVAIVSSMLNTVQQVNFSKVKDYFDFNVFTTGDKEYLRTYNSTNMLCVGSPLYDENAKIQGIFIFSGANYSLFVTLNDINKFFS